MLNTQLFKFDALSNFVGIFIIFFSLLIIIYSSGFMKAKRGLILYYFYIVLTLIASLGAVFSNNLVLFMVCWGFLAFLLYLLIWFGEKEHTPSTAKKSFIIIGGSDIFMLLGLAFVWKITGTVQMDKISLLLNTKASVFAYLCLAIGAFAKAGAMPFHTWVPDTASDAPTPVTAYLPASLDKLLGIYFLGRLSLDMFKMDAIMNIVLMSIGSITIIAAVMMALVQHDLKRLLGYHAVSQVGYMVLGIGTGTVLGIAGGIFHMLNNAIYKAGLFLSGGNVEKKAGTTDLERLGGFAKLMPISFITFLIASLSISGVPPFNGFVSKWLIYQGIIETGKSGGYLWVLWLIAAMFGSALTLASFMKLVHAVFLGQPSKEYKVSSIKHREVSITMWIPVVILAILCVVFGVFAYQIPLRIFIFPSVGFTGEFSGLWTPSLATLLILVGILLGVIIYFIGTVTKTRQTEVFIGGEIIDEYPQMRVSGARFYDTIRELDILKSIYSLAEKGYFDIYRIGQRIIYSFSSLLRYFHNGILSTYLAWCIFGMIILFYVLFR